MRPRTTVIATLTAGAMALTATTAIAGATATGPSGDPADHRHGVGVEGMASMHDDMHDTYPGMTTHMAEFGIDPDQMRDSMVPGHGHGDAAGTGHADGSGWMHD